LVEALGDLGLSAHNAIAIGDAENDHALIEVAEVGVAVGQRGRVAQAACRCGARPS
jgi:hydroxymethylpyrimidine pyrophosphatase-like HAD family hydrolase